MPSANLPSNAPENGESYGGVLDEYMTELTVNNEDVADVADVSASYVRKIRRGPKVPLPERAEAILNYLCEKGNETGPYDRKRQTIGEQERMANRLRESFDRANGKREAKKNAAQEERKRKRTEEEREKQAKRHRGFTTRSLRYEEQLLSPPIEGPISVTPEEREPMSHGDGGGTDQQVAETSSPVSLPPEGIRVGIAPELMQTPLPPPAMPAREPLRITPLAGVGLATLALLLVAVILVGAQFLPSPTPEPLRCPTAAETIKAMNLEDIPVLVPRMCAWATGSNALHTNLVTSSAHCSQGFGPSVVDMIPQVQPPKKRVIECSGRDSAPLPRFFGATVWFLSSNAHETACEITNLARKQQISVDGPPGC